MVQSTAGLTFPEISLVELQKIRAVEGTEDPDQRPDYRVRIYRA
jgi:hypothetical protein